MNRSILVSCTKLVALSALAVVSQSGLAASPDEKVAKQAVMKIVKNPESLKWGKFTPAGTNGACLTVYAKNSLTGLVGAQEAFLQRKDGGWEALYIADIPSGHEGCIAEMAKR